MKRAIVIVITCIGLTIALVIVFGLTRPATHTAHTRATYPVDAAVLWDTLTNFESWPQWYPEIEAVRPLPDRNGRRVIELTSSWGTVPASLVAFEPPTRLQTALDAGSFRGSWTYTLTPVDGSTVLTITERGEVDNPVFRTMMAFMDEHATMLAVHRALGRRLGVTVEPERMERDVAGM